MRRKRRGGRERPRCPCACVAGLKPKTRKVGTTKAREVAWQQQHSSTSNYLPAWCTVASGVRSDIGWTEVEVGRGWSGVEPSLGLRAAPAAEGCVKTYRNVGEAGGIVLSGSDQGKVMAEHFYYPATAMYCRPCRTWRPGGPLGHVHGKGSAQHCRSRLRVSQGRGTSGRAHAPPRHGGV